MVKYDTSNLDKKSPERAKIRTMMKDIIKYLRRDCPNDDALYSRENVWSSPIDSFTVFGCCSTSGVLSFLGEYKDSSFGVFITTNKDEYEEYESSKLTVKQLRKQTDEEYFESLCQWILPNDYQGYNTEIT